MSEKTELPSVGEYARLAGRDVRVLSNLSANIVIVEDVVSGTQERCHPMDLFLVHRATVDHVLRRDCPSADAAVERDGDSAAIGDDASVAGAMPGPADANTSTAATQADPEATMASEVHGGPEVPDQEVPAATATKRVDTELDVGTDTDALSDNADDKDRHSALGFGSVDTGGVIIRDDNDLPGDLEALDAATRQVVMSRYEHLKPLIAAKHTTRAMVSEVAKGAGVNPSSIYNWLSAYRRTGSILSLAPRKGGTLTGQTLIDTPVEKIMSDVIDELYLNGNRSDVEYIYETLKTRCGAENLPAPSLATFRRRIQKVPSAEAIAKRVSAKVAYDKYGPTPEELAVSAPYEMIQIDHTRADVILVEPVTLEPIGRPWVTIAIDVFSRMPAAVYVSMNTPCAASVLLVIWRALIDKTDLLRVNGIEGDWPTFGKIGLIKVDNGRDLRSAAVKLGCMSQGIDIQYRQKLKPADGGAHIERLMGAVAKHCARLPGATGHNVKDREGRKPEKNAGMTLDEFEAEIIDYFVNVYPYKHHQGLNTSPMMAWKHGVQRFGSTISTGPANPIKDIVQCRLDLMPSDRRTIQRYGIQMSGLRYWTDELAPLIKTRSKESRKVPKKFLVRYDPRDLTEIVLYDDTRNRHIVVPLATRNIPEMSRWELKALRKAEKRDGQTLDNEQKITAARMRSDARVATARTRAEKRNAARHRTLRQEARTAQRDSYSRLTGRSAVALPIYPSEQTELPINLPPLDDSAFDDFGDL